MLPDTPKRYPWGYLKCLPRKVFPMRSLLNRTLCLCQRLWQMCTNCSKWSLCAGLYIIHRLKACLNGSVRPGNLCWNTWHKEIRRTGTAFCQNWWLVIHEFPKQSWGPSIWNWFLDRDPWLIGKRDQGEWAFQNKSILEYVSQMHKRIENIMPLIK